MKVIVVGHSPGNTNIQFRSKSATITRIDKWLGECDVYTYSFVNLFAPGVMPHKKDKTNETFLLEYLSGYNKIITLGNEVSQYFSKRNIPHFAASHPSPRNRKFNDKSFEPQLIENLKNYLFSKK